MNAEERHRNPRRLASLREPSPPEPRPSWRAEVVAAAMKSAPRRTLGRWFWTPTAVLVCALALTPLLQPSLFQVARSAGDVDAYLMWLAEIGEATGETAAMANGVDTAEAALEEWYSI